MKNESMLPKWLRTLGYAYSVTVFALAVVLTLHYHLSTPTKKAPALAANTESELEKGPKDLSLQRSREPASKLEKTSHRRATKASSTP